MSLASEAELQEAYRGDMVAARYMDARFDSELHRLLYDRQVAALQRFITRLRPQKILEIAPGPARLTRHIPPTGLVVCLEYNEGMISEGRPVCGERALWIRGNGFQLPFGQCFDLVYSFRFVRHFHRKDRERLYAASRQVLNPNGYFVMDAVNARVSKPLREAHPEEYLIYDKLYRSDELRRELIDARLEPLEFLPVQKYFRWQYRSQLVLGPRASWANRLVIRALERLPRMDGLEWIVICRRA
ncbi:MAG: class I SAM-dependent methyltransferase [Deltaproteobacteria bacterium]|nr:class I SAM-dependent methyltransferase [Deltaproteobacteria bacterium]